MAFWSPADKMICKPNAILTMILDAASKDRCDARVYDGTCADSCSEEHNHIQLQKTAF